MSNRQRPTKPRTPLTEPRRRDGTYFAPIVVDAYHPTRSELNRARRIDDMIEDNRRALDECTGGLDFQPCRASIHYPGCVTVS